MGRKRKAVGGGITRQQSKSDAGKPGTAKRTITMSTNSRVTRTPRKGANGKWDEKKLMTSSKSELVKLDLVKLLTQPEAWNILEQEERQQILDLLPDHVHPHPYPNEEGSIPAPPESFLRYSNHWRDGVRQFQVDLENGHYDPKWLKQAEKAVQERADGNFDKFKEQEFEEFWGQKQKFNRSLAAGESSQIKLGTLVEHGVVRAGDIWKFTRSFGRGGKIVVEKEAKLMGLDGTRMTCIVPAGRRAFLPHVPDTDFHALLAAYKSSIDKGAAANIGNETHETGPEESVDITSPRKAIDLEAEPNATNENAPQAPQADVDEDQEIQRLRKRSTGTSIGPRKKQQLYPPADESSASEKLVPTEELQTAIPDGEEIKDVSRGKPHEHPVDDVPKNGKGDGVPDLGPPETPRRTTRNRGRPRKDSSTVTKQQPSSTAEGQEQPSEKFTGLSVEVRNPQPAGKGGFVSVTIDNKKRQPDTDENVPEPTDNPESKDNPITGPVNQEDQDERKLAIGVNTIPETAPQPAGHESISSEQPPPFTLSPLTLGGVEVAILMDIHGATNLGNNLIRMDGRIEDIPNGNAWKEFRCYRNNQDMGSLWEVRQAWYVKQS